VAISEVGSFVEPLYSSSYDTLLKMNVNDGSTLRINFDVQLYDVECRHVKVSLLARGTEESIAQSRDITLRPVHQNGQVLRRGGGPAIRVRDADIDDDGDASEVQHRRGKEKVIEEDGEAELDSDWSSSHDGFKHQSFEHVIQAHDFTFINFFAGWCSHCQKFAPTWASLAKTVNDKDFKDSGGHNRKVRMIKLNCVDFREKCHDLGIDAYPTLRMYKADGNFSLYEGSRREGELMTWIERAVKTQKYTWGSHYEEFERGCSVRGRLDVPRQPGHLELTVGGGDQDLNSRMTNVSHLVKHFSFSEVLEGKRYHKGWKGFPTDVVEYFSPIDTQDYVTTDFHQAWIHDMQVVRTVNTNEKVAYQISHQKRLIKVSEDDIPQVQFHYDMEPYSIWIKRDPKKWYDFVTTLMAMLGGSFVVMRLATTISLGIHSAATPRSKSGGGLSF
jgi:thiol-disulfide isomerase/thioredoxin